MPLAGCRGGAPATLIKTRTERIYVTRAEEEDFVIVIGAGTCNIEGVIVRNGEMNLAFGELTSYLIGEIGGSAAAHLPLARGVYGEEYDLSTRAKSER